MTWKRFVVFAKRDPSGDIILEFDSRGHMVDTYQYKEWMGPPLEPGQTVECTCSEGFIRLDCPIHAVPPYYEL